MNEKQQEKLFDEFETLLDKHFDDITDQLEFLNKLQLSTNVRLLDMGMDYFQLVAMNTDMFARGASALHSIKHDIENENEKYK